MFHHMIRARLLRHARSRHPLARLVSAMLGLLVFALLLALGTFAIAALLIGGGVFLLVNALRSGRPLRPSPSPAGAAATPTGVIEGEFTIVPGAQSARGTQAH